MNGSVYVIVKRGGHERQIHGVYTDEADAIGLCRDLAYGDYDEYHDWKVLKVPVNTPAPPSEGTTCRYFDKYLEFNHVIFSCRKDNAKAVQ